MAILKQFARNRTGTRVNLTTGLTQSRDSLLFDHQLNVSIPGRNTVHPFGSSHIENSGGILTGRLGAARFNNWIAGYFPNVPTTNSLVHPRATTANLLAATNPSRPDMLLPVFWLELRDLPDMLRQVGRIAKRIYFDRGGWSNLIRPGSVAKDMAAANLAIQFGWKPFVNDLIKIATLQDSVEKRRKELTRLYSGKGLKRRINFGTITTTSTGSSVANSDLGAICGQYYHRTNELRAWGTIRWVPTTGVPKWVPTDGQLRRQLTGLSADAILLNLWEALPWSWLIDWFTPIGATIQGANRTLATPRDACIMRERTTTFRWAQNRYVLDPADPLVISPGISKSIIRERAVGGTLSGSSSFPTLGANQLSILGSLFVLRAR